MSQRYIITIIRNNRCGNGILIFYCINSDVDYDNHYNTRCCWTNIIHISNWGRDPKYIHTHIYIFTSTFAFDIRVTHHVTSIICVRTVWRSQRKTRPSHFYRIIVYVRYGSLAFGRNVNTTSFFFVCSVTYFYKVVSSSGNGVMRCCHVTSTTTSESKTRNREGRHEASTGKYGWYHFSSHTPMYMHAQGDWLALALFVCLFTVYVTCGNVIQVRRRGDSDVKINLT